MQSIAVYFWLSKKQHWQGRETLAWMKGGDGSQEERKNVLFRGVEEGGGQQANKVAETV